MESSLIWAGQSSHVSKIEYPGNLIFLPCDISPSWYAPITSLPSRPPGSSISITRWLGVWFTVVFVVFEQQHASHCSIGACMCWYLLLKYFHKLDSYSWIVIISGCYTAQLGDLLDTGDIKAYFPNILIITVGNNLIKV